MPYAKIEYYNDGKLKSVEVKGMFVDFNIKGWLDKEFK